MAVQVTQDVLDGIDAIRESGETNMLDRRRVQRIAFDNDFHATVIWIEDNPKEYARGVFAGFEPTE